MRSPVPPFTIRRAVLADAPAIADIHVRAWQTSYTGIMPDDFLAGLVPEQRHARWEREILAPDREMTVIVAAENATDRVVGFCSVCPQKRLEPGDELLPAAGELHTMYVDIGFKGGGVGRALIAAGVDALRAIGYTRAVVWMLADNGPARAFYERMGWTVDGVNSLVQYGDVQVREIRMTRSLVPNEES
jgi:GNAT superfamily N-acetyltransferase